MYLFTLHDRQPTGRNRRFSRFRPVSGRIRKKAVVELRPGRTGARTDGELSPGRATK